MAVVLGCFFVFFLGHAVSAADDLNQKIEDLRKQIEELTKQAGQYKGNIAQKQKEANTLKRQIDILNGQIQKLQVQIIITEKNIGVTKLEIGDLEGQIFTASEKIGKQKQTIGELISILHERDQLNLTAVLLKSSTISDFTNQAEQMQNFNSRLISLISDLKEQKSILEQKKSQLDNKKAELENLNKKQVNQRVALNGGKIDKNRLLTQTRGQEVKYQALLNETERKKAEFFAELKKLEAEAIKSGAFIVHVTASTVPPPGTKIFRWPYDDYIITQGYGNTAYARRGAYGGAPHNGIDLTEGYGSPIKPVADGFVLASGYNNGWGNWVAIRHDGGLVSVYAHMRSLSILANSTPVFTGSVIGYEGSTGNVTGSHLHLSIYRDFFTYINPKNSQLYFNYFEGSLNPFDYLR